MLDRRLYRRRMQLYKHQSTIAMRLFPWERRDCRFAPENNKNLQLRNLVRYYWGKLDAKNGPRTMFQCLCLPFTVCCQTLKRAILYLVLFLLAVRRLSCHGFLIIFFFDRISL